MDDRFAALAAWHDLFAVVAGAAATLVGLVFVALALNPAVMADDAPACAPGPARPSTTS